MFVRIAALIGLTLLTTAAGTPPRVALPAGTPVPRFLAACQGKDGWSDPAPPVKVFANVYYVGTCGITALLVASDQGHVLLDAGTAEAAPQVAANIRALGFKLEDVEWIVSSHEHFDHAGGLAELKRLTGARFAASPLAAAALERGTPDWRDPQLGSIRDFAAVKVDRIMRDGEHLTLGPLDLTMHTTPGHAPGSTSWTWRSCEGSACRDMTYIDSVSAVSSDTYKFSQQRVYVDAFARSLGKIAGLPCEVLITPHPSASGLFDRLAGKKPLADADACFNYALAGQATLEQRLKDESGK